MQQRCTMMLICAWIVGSAVPTGSWAKAIHIVATTGDVAAPVQSVAGEENTVSVLASGTMDPHYLEAKPSFIVSMRRADLLVYNGLQLEIGWLPLLLEGARNRKIAWGEAGNVPMSQGIEVLEVPQGSLSRAEGDIHPEGNPHYTLDPRNLVIMAQTAESVLGRLDPEHAAVYAQNRAAFEAEMQKAIAGWEERFAPYRGSKVVCYHKQFEYLLNWLDLEAVDYVENKPGIPPSPRHLEEVERLMRERKIPLLLASTYTSAGAMQQLAEKTGARLLILPAGVGAQEGVDSPFQLFEYLVTQLEGALREVTQR